MGNSLDYNDVQQQMFFHAYWMPIELEGSYYVIGKETVEGIFGEQYELLSLRVNISADFDRMYAVNFTDTAENWEQTTFACSNWQIAESIGEDEMVTKTFGLGREVALAHVNFQRPDGLATPKAEIAMLPYNAVELPTNIPDWRCAFLEEEEVEEQEEECGDLPAKTNFGTVMDALR